MPENYIDTIFREKLQYGETHVEYRESDWDMLAKRLDAQRKPIPWVRIFSAAAAILVMALFASWLFRSPSDDTGQPVAQVQNIQKAHPATPETKLPRTSGTKNSEQATTTNHKATPLLAATANREIRSASSVSGTDQKQEASINKQTLNSVQIPSGTIPPVAMSQVLSAHKTTPRQPESMNKITVSKSLISKIEGGSDWNGLSASLLASTDLNGVGAVQTSSVGSNLGFLLTAHVFHRWSISTGAVYAKKPYTIDYDQYNPVISYPTSVTPSQVHADCRVLDIPIDVNYTVWEKNGNKIGIGTGLSSYIMLSENYYFQYANSGSYTNNSRELHVVDKDRQWLSVLNLQLSYEKQLNPDLSVGIVPYMKLPVKNIGYGRVKLQSMGLAAKLSWSIID